jgi:lysophospholipase L1-like esterase
MKKSLFLLLAVAGCLWAGAENSAKVVVPQTDKTLNTQWKGKTAAYLGDSMTDPQCTATKFCYWGYLEELMGIKPVVYGINGWEWNGILTEAKKMKDEGAKVDAIFILAGTNDFNNSVPIGKFYSNDVQTVNKNDQMLSLKHRTLVMDQSTFCGRINMVMQYLKENFPTKQIILMTPIHRGYANFGPGNVQPDESYANTQDKYIEDYVKALRRAASIWSVPLIDLYTESGLYPVIKSNNIYFHDSKIDNLHPDANGDYRIARTMQFHLLSLPPSF